MESGEPELMERLRQTAESGVFQYQYTISSSPVHVGITITEEQDCLLDTSRRQDQCERTLIYHMYLGKHMQQNKLSH